VSWKRLRSLQVLLARGEWSDDREAYGLVRRYSAAHRADARSGEGLDPDEAAGLGEEGLKASPKGEALWRVDRYREVSESHEVSCARTRDTCTPAHGPVLALPEALPWPLLAFPGVRGHVGRSPCASGMLELLSDSQGVAGGPLRFDDPFMVSGCRARLVERLTVWPACSFVPFVQDLLTLSRQDMTAEWTPPPAAGLHCMHTRVARERLGSSKDEVSSGRRRRGLRAHHCDTDVAPGPTCGAAPPPACTREAGSGDVRGRNDGVSGAASHVSRPNDGSAGGLAGLLLGRSRHVLDRFTDFLESSNLDPKMPGPKA